MAPEPPFLAGAGAKPISSEPESAPGPRTSGAAQKVAAPQHCTKALRKVADKENSFDGSRSKKCGSNSCAGMKP